MIFSLDGLGFGLRFQVANNKLQSNSIHSQGFKLHWEFGRLAISRWSLHLRELGCFLIELVLS